MSKEQEKFARSFKRGLKKQIKNYQRAVRHDVRIQLKQLIREENK